MGRITMLRDIIGAIKDKASLSKAGLVSKSQTMSLHLAVLRATSHSLSTTPDDNQISALLSLGHSSRATACVLISSLMDRLHRTRNSTVALKCLLTVHYIIKRGPFILLDQLSVFPATGGHNYLKLSAFRDGATALTWILSAWVRWYARYIESLLSSSRILGYFLCSSSCSAEKDKQEERLLSFTNADLIKDLDFLVAVIEEICEVPDPRFLEGNKLLYEVIGLLSNDYLSTVNAILSRLSEFNERMSSLSFGESVKLLCALKRLDGCKEKLSAIFSIKKPATETLWGLIDELKNKIGKSMVYKGERKLLTWGKSDKECELARCGYRPLKPNDSVQFSSGGVGINKFSFLVVESIETTI